MILVHFRALLRRRTAFSIPELLMTILVFSFGLLPLIVLFQTSYKTTAKAKNLMVAQSLGRSMIDEIRAMGFDGVKRNYSTVVHTNRQVTGPVVNSDPDGIKFPEYYGRFETMCEAEEIKDVDGKPGKFRIQVTISWKEPDRTFTLGFGTVVVKYGAK